MLFTSFQEETVPFRVDELVKHLVNKHSSSKISSPNIFCGTSNVAGQQYNQCLTLSYLSQWLEPADDAVVSKECFSKLKVLLILPSNICSFLVWISSTLSYLFSRVLIFGCIVYVYVNLIDNHAWCSVSDAICFFQHLNSVFCYLFC